MTNKKATDLKVHFFHLFILFSNLPVNFDVALKFSSSPCSTFRSQPTSELYFTKQLFFIDEPVMVINNPVFPALFADVLHFCPTQTWRIVHIRFLVNLSLSKDIRYNFTWCNYQLTIQTFFFITARYLNCAIKLVT